MQLPIVNNSTPYGRRFAALLALCILGFWGDGASVAQDSVDHLTLDGWSIAISHERDTAVLRIDGRDVLAASSILVARTYDEPARSTLVLAVEQGAKRCAVEYWVISSSQKNLSLTVPPIGNCLPAEKIYGSAQRVYIAFSGATTGLAEAWIWTPERGPVRAEAPDIKRVTLLNESKLRDKLIGNTLAGQNIHGQTWRAFFDPSGEVRGNDGNGPYIARYEMARGILCIQYASADADWCANLSADGTRVYLYRDNLPVFELPYAQALRGNPYGL